MTNHTETSFLVTSCPDHGTKETGDLASARVYVEAAANDTFYARGGFMGTTPETARIAHDAYHADGSDCWCCCDNMVVDPTHLFY